MKLKRVIRALFQTAISNRVRSNFASHGKQGELSDKNHRHVHQTTEAGSNIHASGNILISAADNLTVRQSNISSADGKVLLSGRDVRIEEGRKTRDLDESVYKRSNKLVSRKSNLDQYRSKHDDAIGSNINGKTVSITAADNLSVRGSDIVSETQTVLKAGNELNITAARSTHTDQELHQQKRAGLTGGLKDGVASVGIGASKNSLDNRNDSISLTLSRISSKSGNTTLIAGKDLNAQAAVIHAGKDLHLQGTNVRLLADSVQNDNRLQQKNKQAGISAGITYNPYEAAKSAYEKAKGKGGYSDSIIGKLSSEFNASDKAAHAAGTPLVVNAGAHKSASEQNKSHTQAVTSRLSSDGRTNIIATQGSIISEGADISAEGDALLSAKDKIELGIAADMQNQDGRSKRSGVSFDNRAQITDWGGAYHDKEQAAGQLSQIRGTQLSVGGQLQLQTEKGDIDIIGSHVGSNGDNTILSGGNINILSSQNRRSQTEHAHSQGIGSVQISDTERFDGYMSNKKDIGGGSTGQVKSLVGSTGGNLLIRAKGNYTQQSSDLAAKDTIALTAKRIDISAADNESRSSYREKDLKIGQFSRVSSPIIDLIETVEKASSNKAGKRVQALQGLAAAAQAYEIYKAADAVAKNAASGGALLKVESGTGFRVSGNRQESEQYAAQDNTIKAANVLLDSTEGGIRLQNTRVQANDKIQLDSAADILLESGTDRHRSEGRNHSFGTEAGVGVSVGAQTGVYTYAQSSASVGKNRSSGTAHRNTVLEAGKQAVLKSKGDTELVGAQINARRIDAEVGGRLKIESPQDVFEQSSKQTGGTVRVQISLGSSWELSGNAHMNRANGSGSSVAAQSGLFAGDGGYHIKAGETELKGGAITSAAAKEQNELTTGRLNFSNIRNSSGYEAGSTALSASYKGAGNDGDGSTNFNPTLPQKESGSDSGTTYAVLGEGRLKIDGKETTTAELGIRHGIEGANESVAAVPDLQQVLAKQRDVQTATAQIASAVRTFGSSMLAEAERDKEAAGKELAEAKASENEEARIAAAAKFHEAEKAARDWSISGSKTRALNAVSTIITGALGGQTALQTAINTSAPYAAQTIGSTFGENGSNPNKAAQLFGHAVLGAVVAYVNGGDALGGAVAGSGSEAAAMYLTKTLYPKTLNTDGTADTSKLSEKEKENIRNLSGAVAAVGSGLTGGSLADVQTGGVVGRNAVENNYLTQKLANDLTREYQMLIDDMKGCRTTNCVKLLKEKEKFLIKKYLPKSEELDNELKAVCMKNNSVECTTHIQNSLAYNGGVNPNIIGARSLLKDRKLSSFNVLNVLYNGKNADKLITNIVNSIEDRANFFGTNDIYYKSKGVDIRWFGAAEKVSRACLTGLGASGCLSNFTFPIADFITKFPKLLTEQTSTTLKKGSLNEWRNEAGNMLMNNGFKNFQEAFNNKYISTREWDIKQLRNEQKILQPIHQKFLSPGGFIDISTQKILGIQILDEKSRFDYGCKEMGYNSFQCKF